MSDHAASAEHHPEVPAKTFVWVWIGLVVLTAIEVYLAYIALKPLVMLALLVCLSLIKAALIMSWFMHLTYEKLRLSLMLVPTMIFCIGMMLVYMFWDAVRLSEMRG